jgi:hypothetical protein
VCTCFMSTCRERRPRDQVQVCQRSTLRRMQLAALFLSPVFIALMLWDAFETVILPRRVTRKLRFTRLTYLLSWPLWSYIPRRIKPSKARENFLSFYGPLSIFFLLGLWAIGLVSGFGFLQWGVRAPIASSVGETGLWVDLYLSGTTFFTLGLGDVIPRDPVSRVLTVIEAGLGFGFLALVIGYLPVLYAAFSRREVQISMLDARAGSPPSAAEVLARLGRADALNQLPRFLADWEVMGAETMESHISYTLLIYYRSHHDNQSWLGSIAAVLDTCAMVLAGIENVDRWQAQMTFAMLRHCLVDLAQMVNQPPRPPKHDRLPPSDLEELYEYLDQAGVHLMRTPEAKARLTKLRSMYEPYMETLGDYLVLAMPPWNPLSHVRDNWKTSAFERTVGTTIESRSSHEILHDDH